jgi:hypothetical protein
MKAAYAQIPAPPSIFKYVTAARVDIIANEKICFTPPERFNDLLDVRPRVLPVTDRAFLRQREKEAQKMFINSLPPDKRPKTKKERKRFIRQYASGGVQYIQGQSGELAAKWERELQGVISQHFGVLCFSETRDEPLMWAHYAEEHRGLVIEFDTSHEGFMDLGQLCKVEYLAGRPVYDPAKGAMGFWRQKEARWAYEGEWRIARELRFCEAIKKNRRPFIFVRWLALPLRLSTLVNAWINKPKERFAIYCSQPKSRSSVPGSMAIREKSFSIRSRS